LKGNAPQRVEDGEGGVLGCMIKEAQFIIVGYEVLMKQTNARRLQKHCCGGFKFILKIFWSRKWKFFGMKLIIFAQIYPLYLFSKMLYVYDHYL
jgi:hypothetical protein